MQLFCPTCEASYEIDAAIIPAGGLRLRCRRCRNSWMQGPITEEKTVVPAGIFAPKPAAPAEAATPAPTATPVAAPVETPPTTPVAAASTAPAVTPVATPPTSVQTPVTPPPSAPTPPQAKQTHDEAPDETASTEPAKDSRQPVPLSFDTAKILREEAEREQQARRAERTPSRDPVIGGESKHSKTDTQTSKEEEAPLKWPFFRNEYIGSDGAANNTPTEAAAQPASPKQEAPEPAPAAVATPEWPPAPRKEAASGTATAMQLEDYANSDVFKLTPSKPNKPEPAKEPEKTVSLPARAGVLTDDAGEAKETEQLVDADEFDNDFMEDDWREDRAADEEDPSLDYDADMDTPLISNATTEEDDAAETTQPARAKRKGWFWLPFWGVILSACVAAAAFFGAPYIVEHMPQLEPHLTRYVAQVDGLRAELAVKAQSAVDWINAMRADIGT